ncbi:hypothetical protein [Chryseobacterium indologenes]|uniref:Uncharacterized protein n=1 Tax=Chryseobacterium indologenes TaxID=253 RepID=A0A0N0IV43_CHRID|nr:hypothetical protein [Chryseobacterium indologenes]KPE50132.1 hypothetical protein AOB46_16980 [Chryseobacterium indologenes]
MRKFILTFILFIFFISCSNREDEVKDPYTAFTYMPLEIQGTWEYKISGAENIDAILTFEEKANHEPYMYIKINSYTYKGKPYYPTSGGDGALYFKLDSKNTYSKITWEKYNSKSILFKIENVESYLIEKIFLKSY